MQHQGMPYCIRFLLIFFILINGLSYADTVTVPGTVTNTGASVFPAAPASTPPSNPPTPVVPESKPEPPPSTPPKPVVPEAKSNTKPFGSAVIRRESHLGPNKSIQPEKAPAVHETEIGVIPMPHLETPAKIESFRERGRGMRVHGPRQPIVKIEPHIRSFVLDLDPYPMDIIKTFMLDGLIVPFREDLEGTAYLVGLQDQHRVVGTGYFIYARGLCDVEQKHYAILGQGKSYFHPVTKECLGYHAPIIGKAELTILGPVSQLRVLDAVEVVERKNLLIPTYLLPPIQDFKAKPATTPIEAMILDVKEDWIGIGKYNTVILSIGEREGLHEGDYLDVYNVTARGAICIGCPPKLPDLKIGRVVAFRVYEKMSLALVVEATEEINLLDRARAPMDCNPRPGIGIFEPPSYASPGIGFPPPPPPPPGYFGP